MITQEYFRGSERECRIQCMRLNNLLMENDREFHKTPQDFMNESYRSDFDSSFMSNRSSLTDFSFRHRSSDGDGEPSTIDEDSSSECSSPDRDTKRKFTMSVTPQKDDFREYKRARQSNPFTNIQQTTDILAQNMTTTTTPLVQKQQIPNHRYDKNIRAHFKYQHLMDTSDENSLTGKFINNKPSTTETSLWNAYVDSEMME